MKGVINMVTKVSVEKLNHSLKQVANDIKEFQEINDSDFQIDLMKLKQEVNATGAINDNIKYSINNIISDILDDTWEESSVDYQYLVEAVHNGEEQLKEDK